MGGIFSAAGEPTFRLPLRWGTYRGRHLAAIALLFSGAICIQSATTYVPVFLFAGIGAFFVGWIVLPARGFRRALVILPSFLGVILLLTGPTALPTLVVPLIAWLFARERPPRSYLAVLPAAAVGFVLATMYHEWKDMPLALGIMTGVVVCCAWLAFWAAGAKARARAGAGAGTGAGVRRIPSKLRGRSE